MKKRIAIFASGSGTNTEKIIQHFANSSLAEVVLVLSNKADAFVLKRADKYNIPNTSFTREQLNSEEGVIKALKEKAPDLIVLAGFLWKFPEHILDEFPNQVINIHPALLPKYGGKGMYGMHVHEAVVENHEKETGITIHYVNEEYDDGAIIFQATTAVNKSDTPEDVAVKVHQLEYQHFPIVIEKLLENPN